MGAVQKDDNARSPRGVGTGVDSPQAEPVAKIPRGVRINNPARANHKGRRLAAAALPSSAPGAVLLNNDGSDLCKYATTPAETTISASPAMVRCPIIIAGIAIRKG
jgi:hypothetical protein